jgi:hypothetical protein
MASRILLLGCHVFRRHGSVCAIKFESIWVEHLRSEGFATPFTLSYISDQKQKRSRSSAVETARDTTRLTGTGREERSEEEHGG